MAIEPQELRRVMGHFATGVTVITTQATKKARPMAYGQCLYVTVIEPAAGSHQRRQRGDCYGCFESQNGFTVNFLSEDQEEISRRFATKGADKFADLNGTRQQWRCDHRRSSGYVECKITQCHDGGDHTIVVGEIINVSATGERPLLFFKGKYQRLPRA